MAGKKNSRSSKTDHVLSLLAGAGVEREEEVPAAGDKKTAPAQRSQTPQAQVSQVPQEPQTQQEPQTPQASPAPQARTAAPERHLAPPILEVARLHNEALSETIREALTQSLEEELSREESPANPSGDTAAQEAPVSGMREALPDEVSAAEVPPDEAPEAVPEAEPVEELSTAPDAAQEIPEEIPGKTPPADAETTPDVPAEMPETETAAAPDGTLPDGTVFINVMERLVEERLEKYVKRFGLCSCPRCLADVRALALSRLPAKYVVLPASSAAPMMSLYQAKFDSMVIAQVIQACKTVMESPRHTL